MDKIVVIILIILPLPLRDCKPGKTKEDQRGECSISLCSLASVVKKSLLTGKKYVKIHVYAA